MKEPAEVLPHGDTVAKNSAKQRAKMMPNSKRLSRLRLFCPESAGFTRKHGHLWQTAVRPCCRGMGRIAPPAGANRSTRWCDSLHPLVRIAPPRPPRGSARLGRTDRAATRQRPHPRRPSSAPMPTYISPIEARPFVRDFRLPIPAHDVRRLHGRLGG